MLQLLLKLYFGLGFTVIILMVIVSVCREDRENKEPWLSTALKLPLVGGIFAIFVWELFKELAKK